MIKPLKSVFFSASGLLFLMNLPNVNLLNIIEQAFIFGLGMALLIHAFEDVFKIK